MHGFILPLYNEWAHSQCLSGCVSRISMRGGAQIRPQTKHWGVGGGGGSDSILGLGFKA